MTLEDTSLLEFFDRALTSFASRDGSIGPGAGVAKLDDIYERVYRPKLRKKSEGEDLADKREWLHRIVAKTEHWGSSTPSETSTMDERIVMTKEELNALLQSHYAAGWFAGHAGARFQ